MRCLPSKIEVWRIPGTTILRQLFALSMPKSTSYRRAPSSAICLLEDLVRSESAAGTEGFNLGRHCLAMSTNSMSRSRLSKVMHSAWYKAIVIESVDTIPLSCPRVDLIVF